MSEMIEVEAKTVNEAPAPTLQEEAAKYDKPEAVEPALPSDESKPEVKPDEPPKEEPEDKKAEDENADSSGPNFEEMSARFYENGELEDADYEALEKAGIPRGYVDRFIELEAQAAQAQRTSILSEVGGEDGYKEITEWAKGTLTEKELEVYNRAVSSLDFVEVQEAVRGLNARFQNEHGNEPVRVINGVPGGDRGSTYASHAEMMRDMSDARYRTDPAFRAKVEAKVGRSSLAY